MYIYIYREREIEVLPTLLGALKDPVDVVLLLVLMNNHDYHLIPPHPHLHNSQGETCHWKDTVDILIEHAVVA